MIKIAVSFLAAVFFGWILYRVHYILPFIFLSGAFFCFFLSWDLKFTVLSLSVFFSLMLMPFGGGAGFKLTELLPPILSILLLFELMSKKKPLFSRNNTIIFIGIAVLLLWAAVSYVRNPVSGQILFGASVRESGIRAYYTIFTGICTFFCSFWVTRYHKAQPLTWLRIMLIASLFLGCLRLAGYFAGFSIPFVGGVFRFSPDTQSYFRIGGLGETATLGICVSLCFIHNKERRFLYLVSLTAFFLLLVMSGGRTSFFGASLSLIAYMAFFEKRYLGRFIIVLLICIASVYAIHLLIPMPDQLIRMVTVDGGFHKHDLYRHNTFIYYLKIFSDNPLWGKGIGYIKNISISGSNYGAFASQQLIKGGHSSYLSILCIFGLGGIFFLLTMLFGSMHHAYKMTRDQGIPAEARQLSLFAFLYLVMLSVVYIAGGTGFESIELWFISGMVAGLYANSERKFVYA